VTGKKTISLSQNVLHANSEIAEKNRAALDAVGIVALNLMASPGAGKPRWSRERFRDSWAGCGSG
jgi:hypothetical protein